MSSPAYHPHDRFFRSAFALKGLMVEYVQEFLPPELASRFDLATLEQQKDSYLDKNLDQYFSDVVYTVDYSETKITVTLLLEHKSYMPPHPWLQLLQYMVNAYSAQEKQEAFSGTFCPVIPIIVYHGRQKWQIRPISSYFVGIDEELSPFIPDFQYLLNDLSQYSEEELLSRPGSLVNSAFLALKLSRMRDEFRRVSLVFQRIGIEETVEDLSNFIQLMFVYLIRSGTSSDTIMRAIEKTDSPTKAKVMSAYDQIVQLGVEKAAFKTFKKGMQKGLSLSDLIDLTEIPTETAHQWQKLLQDNPDAELPEM